MTWLFLDFAIERGIKLCVVTSVNPWKYFIWRKTICIDMTQYLQVKAAERKNSLIIRYSSFLTFNQFVPKHQHLKETTDNMDPWVYIYMCVCVLYMYCAHVYDLHICGFICIYAWGHLCNCMYMSVYMCVYLYMCLYEYIYLYVWAYMYVCMDV